MTEPLQPSDPNIRTIDVNQVLSERIRDVRKSLRVSVDALADRLADIGHEDITVSRLWNVQTGRTRPNFDLIPAIANALGIAPLTLMTVPEEASVAIEIAPGVLLSPARYNAWFCGLRPLPGGNEAVFAEHQPYTSEPVHRPGAALDYARTLSDRIASRFANAVVAQSLLKQEQAELLETVADIVSDDLPEEQRRAIIVLRRSLGLDAGPGEDVSE